MPGFDIERRSVGVTPSTLIAASVLTSVTVENFGPETIYVRTMSSVDPATGVPIYAGSSRSFQTPDGSPATFDLYGVTAGGTSVVSVGWVA